jgi:hypothetical protein
MKKPFKILLFIIIILIITGIGIIAANTLLVGHIPISVRNLETSIEFFDGCIFDIATDQPTYPPGENIIITGSITNTNTIKQTIYCKGAIEFFEADDGAVYYISIYNSNYSLVWDRTQSVLDNSTNPIFTGLFGTYNFTLEPDAATHCITTWNQTYGINIPNGPQYTSVPPGIYHVVVELEIDWMYYYGSRFPARHFGKETSITIEQ